MNIQSGCRGVEELPLTGLAQSVPSLSPIVKYFVFPRLVEIARPLTLTVYPSYC